MMKLLKDGAVEAILIFDADIFPAIGGDRGFRLAPRVVDHRGREDRFDLVITLGLDVRDASRDPRGTIEIGMIVGACRPPDGAIRQGGIGRCDHGRRSMWLPGGRIEIRHDQGTIAWDDRLSISRRAGLQNRTTGRKTRLSTPSGRPLRVQKTKRLPT